MKTLHHVAAAAALSLALGVGAASAKPVDHTAALAVGDAAPTFTLQASDGTSVSLDTLREGKNLIVVFFRGTW